MSKKSKRKNNLKESIILLLLLLLLLVSSTYAWFTANQTVTISTLDVNIAAQNGLQISTDGENWKAIITRDDIENKGYSGNTNLIPASMVPVSTVGAIDSGNMVMWYGVVAADENDATGTYKLKAEEQATDDDGKYIVFDMFLRVDSPTQLKLTKGSSVVKKGEETDTGIKQAARVAFCLEGTKDAGSPVGDITSQANAVSFGAEGSTVYIWEPNSNLHTDAAVAHAKNSYGITTTSDGKAEAVEYYGINQTIPADKALPLINTNGTAANTTYLTKITPSYKTKSSAEGVMEAEETIFSLDKGVTKVRTYMWIEGQDVDCEDAASGANISFNLQLQVVGASN